MVDLTPKEVVLALIRVINGESPCDLAEPYLDPNVTIHMDSAIHRGFIIWCKWIHLIRNRGRLSQLRMTPTEVSCDAQKPGLVHVWMNWSGRDRQHLSPITGAEVYHIRYLVHDGRVVEIWTHKRNYVPIFGEWIRWSVLYRLFLGSAVLYFAAFSLRGKRSWMEREC